MSSGRRDKLQQKLRHSAAISAANDDEDEASRKAVMSVVQVWLDRLQLVSVITTFFASIDGTLLSFTIGLTHIGTMDNTNWSSTVQVSNASLAGALIFHVCAAVTSFVGSFVLIRYQLLDARHHLPRLNPIPPAAPPIEKPPTTRFESAPSTLNSSTPPFSHTRSTSSEPHRLGAPFLQAAQTEFAQFFHNWLGGGAAQIEDRVSIHQVRPFHWFSARPSGTDVEPPVRLLSNCHTLSVWMAVAGFVLALTGILTFAWTALPVGIGAFSSACLGICLLAIAMVFSLC